MHAHPTLERITTRRGAHPLHRRRRATSRRAPRASRSARRSRRPAPTSTPGRRGDDAGRRYDSPVASARASFAELVHVEPSAVAIGSQVSVLASVVAAPAPDGAEIVCVDGDFSSIVFPFLVQAHRGVTVRHVPLARLAEAIGPRTWLVAFSLVQSATGEIADADAVIAAAARATAPARSADAHPGRRLAPRRRLALRRSRSAAPTSGCAHRAAPPS